MIAFGAGLRLNLFLVSGDNSNMFTNSYIQAPCTLAIIGLIAESTMELKNDTRRKKFGNVIFQVKDAT